MNNEVLKEKELTTEEKNQEIIKQQLQLLERASKEISSLKRQNHVLYQKQDVFDKMYKMLTLNDGHNRNLPCDKAADIEWEIERHISNLNKN